MARQLESTTAAEEYLAQLLEYIMRFLRDEDHDLLLLEKALTD